MPSILNSPSPPSVLQRPGCWVTFLTLVPLLIGGLYLTENIVGARRVAQVTADLAAAGIELDPHKIPPTRPPDDENFFATPFLAAIGTGSAHSPAMDAVRRIRKWESARIEPVHSAKPTDWTAVRDAIAAKDKQAGITVTDDPVVDLLVSLNRDLTTIVIELTAALARPKSHLVPDYGDRLRAGEDPLEHDDSWIRDVLDLAWALALSARLEIEAGNSAPVSDTVLILLRLAEGVESYGTTLGLLVAQSVALHAGSAAWTAADRRLLPRQFWVEWGNAFSRPRPLDLLPDVVRGEIIYLQHGIRRLRQDPSGLFRAIIWDVNGFDMSGGGGSHWTGPWQRVAAQLIPRGWFDLNEAHALQTLSELHHRYQQPPSPDYFSRESMQKWIRPKIASHGVLKHELFARWALPIYFSTGPQVAATQSMCRLAEIACALEVWFHDRQEYPETLDALVPEYLPAIPTDFDGQPIRYALESGNGRYKLWAIGEDGVDDGGVEKMLNPRPTRTPRPWIEPIGDWVWQYSR